MLLFIFLWDPNSWMGHSLESIIWFEGRLLERLAIRLVPVNHQNLLAWLAQLRLYSTLKQEVTNSWVTLSQEHSQLCKSASGHRCQPGRFQNCLLILFSESSWNCFIHKPRGIPFGRDSVHICSCPSRSWPCPRTGSIEMGFWVLPASDHGRS